MLMTVKEALKFLNEKGLKLTKGGLFWVGYRWGAITETEDNVKLVDVDLILEHYRIPEGYLTVNELMKEFNINRNKVYDVIKKLKLPYLKRGKGNVVCVKIEDFKKGLEKYEKIKYRRL